MCHQVPFESFVEPDIVERGRLYHLNEHVSQVERLSETETFALVEGAQSYEVYLNVSEGKVIDHFCSCPYHWGEFCKHEVAVMFLLRVREYPLARPVAEQIDQLTCRLTDKELRQFVVECLKKSLQMRERFFERYAV